MGSTGTGMSQLSTTDTYTAVQLSGGQVTSPLVAWHEHEDTRLLGTLSGHIRTKRPVDTGALRNAPRRNHR